MGFIIEKYLDNRAGLIVSFQNSNNTGNYFNGNNVEDALNYFNMYVKDNMLYVHTDEEIMTETAGIASIEEATQLREELNEISAALTDEEAIERPILFPKWKEGITYTVGARIRYGGRIFKVLQAHTSTAEWTPSRAPSLFAEILTSEDGEPQEWQQPTSTNAYLTGDKVIYDGKVYESLIDFNVWRPDQYPQGWQLVEEPAPEPIIAEWQQPDSTNPYMTGDKVLFNGQTYESVIDNNIWSPETYPAGWSLIE